MYNTSYEVERGLSREGTGVRVQGKQLRKQKTAIDGLTRGNNN